MFFRLKHLSDAKESFFDHFRVAIYFAINSLYCFIVLTIHALFPFIFVTNGSDCIKKLFSIMSKRVKFTEISINHKQRIAIIGFGASSISLVLNFAKYAKSGTKIDIYDDSFSFGKGVAYSTININHVLNVRAGKMSIDSEDDDHFINWLSNNGYNYDKNDFVPRAIYGIYLQNIFNKSKNFAKKRGVLVDVFQKKAENIKRYGDCFSIENEIYTDIIFAKGVKGKSAINPYEIDFKEYCKNKNEIHIKGSGLSAVDIVFSILNTGFNGKIILHSRSNRFVIPHSNSTPMLKPIITKDDAKNMSLNKIAKKFITICKEQNDWRSGFDSIRPVTQEIWNAFNDDKKEKFLSTFSGIFNKHRHRCPEFIFEKLLKLIEEKLLILTTSTVAEDFIDCTGLDFFHFDNDLKSLIAKNLLIENKFGGLESKCENIFIIGGLNFGKFFETIAIPEIKNQARDICNNIVKKSKKL